MSQEAPVKYLSQALNDRVFSELNSKRLSKDIITLYDLKSSLRSLTERLQRLSSTISMEASIKDAGSHLPEWMRGTPIVSNPFVDRELLVNIRKVISNLVRDYLRMDSELSEIRGHQLLKPSYSISKDPRTISVERLDRLWNAWSRVVLKDFKQSSLLPFYFKESMFYRLFLAARTVSGSLGARRNLLKRLTTPIKWAPFLTKRALVLFWFLESLYSLAFLGTILTFVSVLSLIWYKWDGDSSSLIPLVLTTYIPNWSEILDVILNLPNVRLSDLIDHYLSVPVTWGSWVFNLSLKTIIYGWASSFWLSINHNYSDILQVIALNGFSLSADWWKIIGIPLGVFYKFGLYPIWEILTIPYHWWVGDTLGGIFFSAWTYSISSVKEVFWYNWWMGTSQLKPYDFIDMELLESTDSVENPWTSEGSPTYHSADPEIISHYFPTSDSGSITERNSLPDFEVEPWTEIISDMAPGPDNSRSDWMNYQLGWINSPSIRFLGSLVIGTIIRAYVVTPIVNSILL